MRLVACSQCRTQYDVSLLGAETFACRCGASVANRALEARDQPVHRCSSCGGPVAADASRCPYCRGAIVRDPKLLSLICPGCFARNTEASRFCTACGIAFDPQPVALAPVGTACVKCEGTMHATRVGGIETHECSSCHGLWVPGERFDELVERAIEARRNLTTPFPRVEAGNPMTERVAYRRCPTCSQLMARRNYRQRSGVIIDQCRDHGTWLDPDELELIAGFVRSGGLERAAATEIEVGLVSAKKKDVRPELVRMLTKPQSVPVTPGYRVLQSISAFLSDLLGR